MPSEQPKPGKVWKDGKLTGGDPIPPYKEPASVQADLENRKNAPPPAGYTEPAVVRADQLHKRTAAAQAATEEPVQPVQAEQVQADDNKPATA